MIYDSARQLIILFGGSESIMDQSLSYTYAATWEYDIGKATWTRIETDTSPSASALAQASFDDATGQMVLFGGEVKAGNNSAQTNLNEVWRFNPETSIWTKLTPTNTPSARAFSGMVYNPHRDRIFLLGGRTGLSDPGGEGPCHLLYPMNNGS